MSLGDGVKVRTADSLSSSFDSFYTSLLVPLRVEAEAEGYPPLFGGSKSVAPNWLWALIDLAIGPKNQKSGEAAGKPAIVSDCDYRSFI